MSDDLITAMRRAILGRMVAAKAKAEELTATVSLPRGSTEPVIHTDMSKPMRVLVLPGMLFGAAVSSMREVLCSCEPGREREAVEAVLSDVRDRMEHLLDAYLKSRDKEADGHGKT